MSFKGPSGIYLLNGSHGMLEELISLINFVPVGAYVHVLCLGVTMMQHL